MYIIKNAFRCISRSKSRNVLIGIIVLVIAVSACIGLSIRRAAENARTETLNNLSVTATISFDRQSAMKDMAPPSDNQDGENSEPPEFDRSKFSEMMGNSSALSLEEYEKYAENENVKEMYYSMSVSFNGSEGLEPVSSEENTESADSSQDFGGMGGRGGMINQVMGSQSDFTLIGFSGENAMTDFLEGNATITSGEVFEESTENYHCIISEELATYNDITVGAEIYVTNPNNEDETYTLTVVGIYSDSTANQNSFSMMGMTSTDPANKIYMSYNALNSIVEASSEISTTQTDEDTGREYETGLTGSLEATYSFSDVEAYEAFAEEVYEMGLDESYTVSSQDITSFENSLTPLNTLSTTAGYFLAVILIIGAVILVVLNIFNVRERKYEIGVLTAMGMKKGKVALQFITEIFAVTLIAVIIGAAVGAVCSVPVANALLENQNTSQETRLENIEQGFGRGEKGNMPSGDAPEIPNNTQGGFSNSNNPFNGFMGAGQEYITEISSATDFTVILQMLGIAVILTIIAGAASMLFIMRYEPLRILSNRD